MKKSFCVRVRSITIDTFVKREKLDRVDFIEIDTEGSEMEILKGAKNTIKKFKHKIVVAAYYFTEDKKGYVSLYFL